MKQWKNRITYKNKTYLQVELLYKRNPNVHDSDRFRITMFSKDHKEKSVYYLHALEAVDLIYLLSAAVGEAISKNLPLYSND